MRARRGPDRRRGRASSHSRHNTIHVLFSLVYKLATTTTTGAVQHISYYLRVVKGCAAVQANSIYYYRAKPRRYRTQDHQIPRRAECVHKAVRQSGWPSYYHARVAHSLRAEPSPARIERASPWVPFRSFVRPIAPHDDTRSRTRYCSSYLLMSRARVQPCACVRAGSGYSSTGQGTIVPACFSTPLRIFAQVPKWHRPTGPRCVRALCFWKLDSRVRRSAEGIAAPVKSRFSWVWSVWSGRSGLVSRAVSS